MSKMKNHSNITSPQYHTAELDQLLRENSRIMSIPAKTVFLEPGESMDGIYYIAKGRTRHYMVAKDHRTFLQDGCGHGHLLHPHASVLEAALRK